MRKRRFVVLGVTSLVAFVLATGSSAVSSSRNVQILDDCDPPTFNAAVGPGTCVKDGSTTFSEFIGQLLAQGRAPAWRFAPDHLKLATGGTLVGRNIGGEDHTLTEVANFGGGCIGALNARSGCPPCRSARASPAAPSPRRWLLLERRWRLHLWRRGSTASSA